MAGLEVPHRGGGGGGRDLAGRDPLGAVEVHQSDEVPHHWGAAVVLRGGPAQLHVLSSDLINFTLKYFEKKIFLALKYFLPHLVWLECPRSAGHVQYIDVASGLEISSLASETDLVDSLVLLSVSLPHCQDLHNTISHYL